MVAEEIVLFGLVKFSILRDNYEPLIPKIAKFVEKRRFGLVIYEINFSSIFTKAVKIKRKEEM